MNIVPGSIRLTLICAAPAAPPMISSAAPAIALVTVKPADKLIPGCAMKLPLTWMVYGSS